MWDRYSVDSRQVMKPCCWLRCDIRHYVSLLSDCLKHRVFFYNRPTVCYETIWQQTAAGNATVSVSSTDLISRNDPAKISQKTLMS